MSGNLLKLEPQSGALVVNPKYDLGETGSTAFQISPMSTMDVNQDQGDTSELTDVTPPTASSKTGSPHFDPSDGEVPSNSDDNIYYSSDSKSASPSFHPTQDEPFSPGIVSKHSGVIRIDTSVLSSQRSSGTATPQPLRLLSNSPESGNKTPDSNATITQSTSHLTPLRILRLSPHQQEPELVKVLPRSKQLPVLQCVAPKIHQPKLLKFTRANTPTQILKVKPRQEKALRLLRPADLEALNFVEGHQQLPILRLQHPPPNPNLPRNESDDRDAPKDLSRSSTPFDGRSIGKPNEVVGDQHVAPINQKKRAMRRQKAAPTQNIKPLNSLGSSHFTLNYSSDDSYHPEHTHRSHKPGQVQDDIGIANQLKHLEALFQEQMKLQQQQQQQLLQQQRNYQTQIEQYKDASTNDKLEVLQGEIRRELSRQHEFIQQQFIRNNFEHRKATEHHSIATAYETSEDVVTDEDDVEDDKWVDKYSHKHNPRIDPDIAISNRRQKSRSSRRAPVVRASDKGNEEEGSYIIPSSHVDLQVSVDMATRGVQTTEVKSEGTRPQTPSDRKGDKGSHHQQKVNSPEPSVQNRRVEFDDHNVARAAPPDVILNSVLPNAPKRQYVSVVDTTDTAWLKPIKERSGTEYASTLRQVANRHKQAYKAWDVVRTAVTEKAIPADDSDGDISDISGLKILDNDDLELQLRKIEKQLADMESKTSELEDKFTEMGELDEHSNTEAEES